MNPQITLLIEALRAAAPPGVPRIWDLSPPAARESAELFFARLNDGGPTMTDTREIQIRGRRGSVAARLYVPDGAPARSAGFLFMHGGGFVIGSPATHDRLCRELAHGLAARVVSLHYALAPEFPFPAGLDDVVDAARWLGTHGATIGVDPSRLLIGGDSAGASLTAGALLRLRDEQDAVRFRAALLIYGRYAEGLTPSLAAWGDRDLVLSRKSMDWFFQHYKQPPGDPYAAPLLADLDGFPPAILVVGTLDPLLSDSELFAEALRKANVPVELHVYQDGIHAFAQMFLLDMAADAIGKLVAFGRRALEETR